MSRGHSLRPAVKQSTPNAAATRHVKTKKLKMSALKDLWPGGPLGDDQKVYDYILEGIKTKNYGVEIVTSAFVEDLKKLLHLKKSRHEPTPNSCLSREQLCHILGYLVCQMKAEDVSKNFQHALLKEVTKVFLVNHVQDLGFHLLNLVVHQILLYLVHKLIQKVLGWVCHSCLNKPLLFCLFFCCLKQCGRLQRW